MLEIAPDNLKLLDKTLGEGQFGIVKQGLLTTVDGDSEVVAVKTLKGIVLKIITIMINLLHVVIGISL